MSIVRLLEFLWLLALSIAGGIFYFSPHLHPNWNKGWKIGMIILVFAVAISEILTKGLTGKGYEDRIAEAAANQFCLLMPKISACVRRSASASPENGERPMPGPTGDHKDVPPTTIPITPPATPPAPRSTVSPDAKTSNTKKQQTADCFRFNGTTFCE
jgi:hypothetical protein